MSTPDTREGVPPLSCSSPSVRQLHQQLTESLKLRVLNVPLPEIQTSSQTRIAVLFSGGLDCTVLARLASDLIPAEQGIDLLNVAFENPRVAQHRGRDAVGSIYEACPDRVTGRKAFAELVAFCPSRKWRFVAVRCRAFSDTLPISNKFRWTCLIPRLWPRDPKSSRSCTLTTRKWTCL